ncbi:Sir2 family NAD-dependent protein deacetylase [Paraburkholderia sp. MM5496-R1]|uniref:Sir2 family NAD-dependent protein deacetylase n=1 Tax=Paraburkholderia sp. MM5496-R1 TaxID=2991065 RepID=UPI003D24F27A
MGVDSGLPDFRGDHGFWAAYPALKTGGINFHDIANGTAFLRDPVRAWGFYGHRLNLDRRAVPHAGFESLRRWASAKRSGGFVFTSNVDGQFQKAASPTIACSNATDRSISCNADSPAVRLNKSEPEFSSVAHSSPCCRLLAWQSRQLRRSSECRINRMRTACAWCSARRKWRRYWQGSQSPRPKCFPTGYGAGCKSSVACWKWSAQVRCV